MATEATINIESPNVTVDAPVDVGLKGFTDDITERLRILVGKVRSGDDEVMTAIMLGVSFVVAGVFIWRRL
jgi:hypothetical protein